MDELPSQSHRSREPRETREIQPIITTGRIRKTPVGRKLLDTFFLGDLRETIASMIWNTFFPNLRENFSDSLHDGVDNLLHGTEGGYRPSRGRSYRTTGSGISKHNPDRALGARGTTGPRFSREDRARQDTSAVEIDSRAAAEEILNAMNNTIDQYDEVRLSEFYQLAGITPDHTEFGWGWEDLGGAKIGHSRGVYFLDLPPVIKLSSR